MKNKDFTELAKRLLPDLPGFAVKAPLMFIPPVQHTLRGLCFESHSYERNLFYLWVFFQPLFIPTKNIILTFGKRIGNDRWNRDSPDLVHELGDALKHELQSFLSPIESPLDVAQAAKSLQLHQNPNVQQVIAYALARAGEVDKAVAELDVLLAMLDQKVPWQMEMSERANALASLLLSDPPIAQKQFDAWEAESIRNLGLEKFR